MWIKIIENGNVTAMFTTYRLLAAVPITESGGWAGTVSCGTLQLYYEDKTQIAIKTTYASDITERLHTSITKNTDPMYIEDWEFNVEEKPTTKKKYSFTLYLIGQMNCMSREQACSLVDKKGGVITDLFDESIDAVIACNGSLSPIIKQAQDMAIQVWTEKRFMEFLEELGRGPQNIDDKWEDCTELSYEDLKERY